MSRRPPHSQNSHSEDTSLVSYEEPPPEEYYYDDEPEYDYAGRTGVREEEQDVDYSIYAMRKDRSVKYRNPDQARCRKIWFGICLIFCCLLIIGALIAGIVLVLQSQAEEAASNTFSPTVSDQPTYMPISPPTFPPTINVSPTVSPKPTITFKPSMIPSFRPTTGAPSTSAQPSAGSELLMALGEEDNGSNEKHSLDQFGAQTSFTVNEQGIYEFVMEFKHNENMPMGDDNYEGSCENFEETKIHDYDQRPFREPRKFFRRVQDYVWKATGFQHISLDWHPCGAFPRNYAHPHYDITFFRVTPEDRLVYLECAEQQKERTQQPDINRACETTQTTDHGKDFYILPSSAADRLKVPNLPPNFEQAEFYAPYPYVGMQYYDIANQPTSPEVWNDLDMGMSTHGGDIMSWKAKIPYRIISGTDPQFNSKTAEYYQPTITSFPDAFSVFYKEDGIIRFQITGLSQITKTELDALKAANPQDSLSEPLPFPIIPECICNPPDLSAAPSSIPSFSPSTAPSIPRFDSCNLLTGNEASTNVVINCFSIEYDCNKKDIKDCHVECGPLQCASSQFSESNVQCIDDTSCNKISSADSVAQFTNSKVLCQVAGSCAEAVFLDCTCCDGAGCPVENFAENPLPSCVGTPTEMAAFCDQLSGSQTRTCRELGNPVCTNL